MKMQFISEFLYIAKSAVLVINADVSKIQRVSHVIYIFIKVPSFIIVGYVWQIVGRGAILPPHPWATPKKPTLNRVMNA